MKAYIVDALGKVTLSEDVLRHLGVRPGERLSIAKLPSGRIEMRATRATGKISDSFGMLKSKRKGRPLSIEEINEVIARG